MSDMIERLRAVADGAAAPIAAGLAEPAAVEEMSARVRLGVRRRRGVQAAVAGAAALVLGVGAVVIPPLMDREPVPGVPGPRMVERTEGSLTVFDDGSMSVLLDSGRTMEVPPAEGDSSRIRLATKAGICALTTDSLPALGWAPADGADAGLVSFGRLDLLAPDGTTMAIPQGSVVPDADHEKDVWWPPLVYAIQADPGVAPHLVVGYTMVRIADGEAQEYASFLEASPPVSVQGSESSGGRIATLTTRAPRWEDSSTCYSRPLPEDLVNGVFDLYVFADVWITDRLGTVAYAGTFTSWVRAEMDETR